MSETTPEKGTAPANAAETPIPTGIRLTPFDEVERAAAHLRVGYSEGIENGEQAITAAISFRSVIKRT
jgi:hypothetical protein